MENDRIRGRRGRGASRGRTRSEPFALGRPRAVRLAPEQEREAVGLLAGLIADAASKRCPGTFGGASAGVMDGAFSSAPESGAQGEGPVSVRDRGA
jgi:hypothetical protein